MFLLLKQQVCRISIVPQRWVHPFEIFSSRVNLVSKKWQDRPRASFSTHFMQSPARFHSDVKLDQATSSQQLEVLETLLETRIRFAVEFHSVQHRLAHPDQLTLLYRSLAFLLLQN